jgi:hypothetical protein
MRTGMRWLATMAIPTGLKIKFLKKTKIILPMKVATTDAKGEKGRRSASHRAVNPNVHQLYIAHIGTIY